MSILDLTFQLVCNEWQHAFSHFRTRIRQNILVRSNYWTSVVFKYVLQHEYNGSEGEETVGSIKSSSNDNGSTYLCARVRDIVAMNGGGTSSGAGALVCPSLTGVHRLSLACDPPAFVCDPLAHACDPPALVCDPSALAQADDFGSGSLSKATTTHSFEYEVPHHVYCNHSSPQNVSKTELWPSEFSRYHTG